jgi:hypothetical protein
MERLPRVAFNTFLDVYFAGCFGFFVLVIASSVFAVKLGGSFDEFSAVLICVAWVIFNFACVIKAERVLREADGEHISRAWIPPGMTQREAMVEGRRGGNPKGLWTFNC